MKIPIGGNVRKRKQNRGSSGTDGEAECRVRMKEEIIFMMTKQRPLETAVFLFAEGFYLKVLPLKIQCGGSPLHHSDAFHGGKLLRALPLDPVGGGRQHPTFGFKSNYLCSVSSLHHSAAFQWRKSCQKTPFIAQTPLGCVVINSAITQLN